ncbi:zona pellucida sperm-binding protein 3-like [Apteryx mantelli]|uniref:Zona pellucida sperm-binding protein 3-like n=1 Tax=Apteryx mantelli TaxID=2696672 RepID=A0ABM4FEQ9_9AVES
MGLWRGSLVVVAAWGVLLAAQRAPPGLVSYGCNGASIHLTVRWDPEGHGLMLDLRSLHLGSCPPSAVNSQQGLLHFQYKMKDCGFSCLVSQDPSVSGDMVEHFADLRYWPPYGRDSYYSSPFVERISCTGRGGSHLSPVKAALVRGQLSASGVLLFSVALLNADVGAPSDPPVFLLGSQIQLVFAVERHFHQPLQIFVDECVATAIPELHKSQRNYTIITNHGCLVEGKVANSYYLPRATPEVLQLSLQAFEFVGAGSDIYLHCQVLVWDPELHADVTRKACSFHRDTGRWELLDEPSASSVCDCCDHHCSGTSSRARRDLHDEDPLAAWEGVLDEDWLAHAFLIGPLKVQAQLQGLAAP